MHACDVLSTLHRLLEGTQLVHWFSDLELFSMLFAAAIHDLEHTGKNSKYESSYTTESIRSKYRFAESADSSKVPIRRKRRFTGKLSISRKFREVAKFLNFKKGQIINFISIQNLNLHYCIMINLYWRIITFQLLFVL